MTPCLNCRLGPTARVCACAIVGLMALSLLTAANSERDPTQAAQAESAAQDRNPPVNGQAPSGNIVRQGFPAAKFVSNDFTKCDTGWEIEWELTHPDNRPMMPPGTTMRIKTAKFTWKNKAGQPQWITVARMLELGEIYVPYDNGYIAFMDVHHHSFYTTPARKEFLGPNCVAPGEVLKSANPTWNETVHKEVHDDGVR